tara:strand:- start:242 stop:412 length:171 start_codon:yes stop_codon:yes gene_type:complete
MKIMLAEISLKLLYAALIILTIFLIINFETVYKVVTGMWGFFLLIVFVISGIGGSF